MKNVIFLFFWIWMNFPAFSQTEATDPRIQAAVEKAVALYGLDELQQKEMYKIQARRFRNLAEIEHLRAQLPDEYLLKLRALAHGHYMSIEKILREDQRPVFLEQQINLRTKKAALHKELKSAGATQNEINQKITEFELENL